jgi:hypothetical protein
MPKDTPFEDVPDAPDVPTEWPEPNEEPQEEPSHGGPEGDPPDDDNGRGRE